MFDRNVKATLCCILLGLALLVAPAAEVSVGTNVFQPAFTNSSSDGSLVEYVPAGETLKTWTRLFAVRRMQRVTSPKKYIEQLGQEYRRKYPAMPVAAAGLEASNRWFIDFISYPQKNEPRFVEWNFFRAEPGQRGIIVYEYTERKPFTKSALDAMKELNVKELPARMVSMLATNDFGVR